MFNWLKRRMLRAHQKLLWQNEAVATDTELKTRLLFQGRSDLVQGLDSIASVATEMAAIEVPPNGLPQEQCEIGLKINRDLRKLFEIGYQARATQFDPKYTPLGGWDMFYERKAEGA